MSTVAAIGDCVVDVFTERRLAYPGGNALNVAAYLVLREGVAASFTGIVGDDEFGTHITATLAKLGVETPRMRIAKGDSGQALVGVAPAGDRVFLASNWGGVQSDLALRLAPQDRELLAAADLIHTSIYSNLDHELPTLAELARVSYDFSNAPPIAQIAHLLPLVSVAFFSAAHLDAAQRLAYAERALELGAGTVVLTAGAEGAIGAQGGRHVQQPIIPTKVVDTLGAGDGFIAGFLAAWLAGAELDAAMSAGARSGSRSCGYEGAFGHPIPVTDDQISRLLAHGPRPL